MSRIGIRPLKLEDGVQLTQDGSKVTLTGTLGTVIVSLPVGLKLANQDGKLLLTRDGNTKTLKSLHGTFRRLLENAAVGVSKGFEKRLDLVGIGYRAAIEGSDLNLLVGYTHPVKMAIPESIEAKVEKSTIVMRSYDKVVLGEFAAKVRKVREPEPYKGKGIRYSGEKIRLKAGKAAKTGS